MSPVPILSTNGYIGVGKQVSFGTPVAPTVGLFTKYLSESLANEQEEIKGVEGGQGRYMIESYKSLNRAGGDIAFYGRPDIIGFFLNAVLGNDAYSVGVPSVHVITPTVPKVITIERGIDPATPLLIERFQDCYVSDLTIEGEASNPVKVTASLKGTKGVVQVAASTPSYETNAPFFFFDTPTYTIDGGATAVISKYSMKISNNIDEWFGSAITPTEIIEKLLTIELSFTVKFETVAHYKKVYYGAGVDIVNTIADGSFRAQMTYGAGATLRSLDLYIKHIKHIRAPVNLDGSAATIMQDCEGYAVKVGADNLIDVEVKNTFAADYDA